MTSCYVELGPRNYVQDIIVTNFRIIGGYTSTYIVGATESFSINLWHPKLAELPEFKDKLGSDPVTGSGVIKEISLEKDDALGNYLKIKSSSMLMGYFSIYHTDSQKIFQVFSSPLSK